MYSIKKQCRFYLNCKEVLLLTPANGSSVVSKYKTTTNLSPSGLTPNSHGLKVSNIKTMSGYQNRIEREKGEKGERTEGR